MRASWCRNERQGDLARGKRVVRKGEIKIIEQQVLDLGLKNEKAALVAEWKRQFWELLSLNRNLEKSVAFFAVLRRFFDGFEADARLDFKVRNDRPGNNKNVFFSVFFLISKVLKGGENFIEWLDSRVQHHPKTLQINLVLWEFYCYRLVFCEPFAKGLPKMDI